MEFWHTDKIWNGEDVVILASGSSLRIDDIRYCEGRARIISINSTYQKAPDSDLFYAADFSWWLCPDNKHAENLARMRGIKCTIENPAPWDFNKVKAIIPDIKILRNSGLKGYDPEPDAMRTGSNSGYQAVHLAAKLGARRIILLGFDMREINGKRHHHADHTNRRPLDTGVFEIFIREFNTIVKPLQDMGIEVFNCTAGSALKCFPAADLRSVLN